MTQKNNPLHGKTLQIILEELLEHYRWEGLAHHIKINCFVSKPSIKSSLVFLRKTPWARLKVEELYLRLKNNEDDNTKA
ncbi:MAG: VF530 family protein [Bacteroidota bacterium]|nr:VF530 family protein [Bacteroidota bacterium]